jgi:hypothetical protein
LLLRFLDHVSALSSRGTKCIDLETTNRPLWVDLHVLLMWILFLLLAVEIADEFHLLW